MKPHLVSLVTMGDYSPLPFPVAETWLLDPHDPLEVLLPRLTRWISESPGAWILAQRGASAVLLSAVQRLDLRIAGAALISPRAWVGRRDRLSLPVEPLSFPVLLAEREAGRLPAPVALVRAWKAQGAPSPFTWPEGFLKLLRSARRPQASTEAKAASDVASSTEDIASRTSSIVARTAQIASSGQSEQGK